MGHDFSLAHRNLTNLTRDNRRTCPLPRPPYTSFMPHVASLIVPETRRVLLSEQRKRRLLSPLPVMREWVWIVQLWAALATSITFIVYLLDLPGALELRGWVAAAFVWLPGPGIATAVATIRALGLRNPASQAQVRRLEEVRRHAANALERELRAIEGGRVLVDELDLEVRQAFVVRSPVSPDTPPTWVLVIPTPSSSGESCRVPTFVRTMPSFHAGGSSSGCPRPANSSACGH